MVYYAPGFVMPPRLPARTHWDPWFLLWVWLIVPSSARTRVPAFYSAPARTCWLVSYHYSGCGFCPHTCTCRSAHTPPVLYTTPVPSCAVTAHHHCLVHYTVLLIADNTCCSTLRSTGSPLLVHFCLPPPHRTIYTVHYLLFTHLPFPFAFLPHTYHHTGWLGPFLCITTHYTHTPPPHILPCRHAYHFALLLHTQTCLPAVLPLHTHTPPTTTTPLSCH